MITEVPLRVRLSLFIVNYPLIDVPVSNGILNDDTVKLFTPCLTDFGITEVVIIADTNALHSGTLHVM